MADDDPGFGSAQGILSGCQPRSKALLRWIHRLCSMPTETYCTDTDLVTEERLAENSTFHSHSMVIISHFCYLYSFHVSKASTATELAYQLNMLYDNSKAFWKVTLNRDSCFIKGISTYPRSEEGRNIVATSWERLQYIQRIKYADWNKSYTKKSILVNWNEAFLL